MRRINQEGLDLLKKAEGLRLKAYPDPGTGGEPFTIGYGHTGDVKKGDQITEHQADAILELDLERFEKAVDQMAPGASDNEFSAMVSFAFNLGAAALQRSSLLKKFLAGDKAGAASEFMKWVNAAGKVMPGLVKRRAAEKTLFLKP